MLYRMLVFVLVVTLPALSEAQTGTGVRPEEDARGVLVARDIGGQRWSIRFGLAGDTIGRATGIVTDPFNASAEPVFIQCETVDARGNPDDIDSVTLVFDCAVGPRCPSRVPGSCVGWENVGLHEIRASFFLPPR